MKNKRLIVITGIVSTLLLIPAVAMQFTEEVNWNLFDFVVAGSLLLGTGISIDFVIRKVNKIKLQITLCVALLAVLLLIWAELAVGVFDTAVGGF